MYQQGRGGEPETIVIPGTRTVTGGSWPVRIWTGIMEKALAGAEVVPEFPEPVEVEPTRRRRRPAPSAAGAQREPRAERASRGDPHGDRGADARAPTPTRHADPDARAERRAVGGALRAGAERPGPDPSVEPPGQGRAPVQPGDPLP